MRPTARLLRRIFALSKRVLAPPMVIVARTQISSRLSRGLVAANNRKRRLGLPWLVKPIRSAYEVRRLSHCRGDCRGKLIIGIRRNARPRVEYAALTRIHCAIDNDFTATIHNSN